MTVIFRHQLAVYSPITAMAGPRALAAMLRLRRDPRPLLRDLLLREYAADDVVLCGSGTQALQLAILIARRSAGGDSPVALPAFSCFDVASAAIGAGAPIALYDLDPQTLAPNPESLARVLGAGVRVVVISPLYGIPVDWEALEAIAAPHGAILIEDAAQGHGAASCGRKLGAIGRLSTVSFGRGKGWTGGTGGAVLLRDGGSTPGPEALVSASVRSEATTIVGSLAQWMLGRPRIYGIPRSIPALGLGVTTYRAPSVPASMTRAAAEGILANYDASIAEAVQRRANAGRLLDQIDDRGSALPMRINRGDEPGYLRLPVLARKSFLSLLGDEQTRRLGIERSYPISLAELDVVATRLQDGERRWPGADSLSKELVTLPTHSRVSETERDLIVALVHR